MALDRLSPLGVPKPHFNVHVHACLCVSLIYWSQSQIFNLVLCKNLNILNNESESAPFSIPNVAQLIASKSNAHMCLQPL